MNNGDIKYAIKYHEETKHSQLSVRMSRHYLDWDNRPKPFKVYTRLRSIPLPRNFPLPSAGALNSISGIKPTLTSPESADAGRVPAVVDINTLAEILFFSAGITREIKHDSGTYYMRAASATGALYPIELYIICQDIAGLKAGVYHFCPGSFMLTELRKGDYRTELAEATGGKNSEGGMIIMSAPVTVAFTSIAWRNAWKYQARSYRHWFWDAGVIAANFLATTVSEGLPTRLIMGFVDTKVNRLLCLEERKEAAVALAPIGIDSSATESVSKDKDMSIPPSHSTPIAVVHPEVMPLSKTEVDYPEIWEMQAASSLADTDQVRAWVNSAANLKKTEQRAGEGKNLLRQLLKYEVAASVGRQQEGATLHEVILRRGSSRMFARSPISFDQLSTILNNSTTGVPLDFLKNGDSIIDVYLIANAVEGLQPGSYFFNREANFLEELGKQKGQSNSRNESGFLCLGQPLFSDASAVFFLMTDMQTVLKALGNRGYRAAQFEAGIVAGKIYLAAYAQGIGASGSTFYDDAVTEYFSPHARGRSTMIAVGVGIPTYKARSGKILAGKLTRDQLLFSP